MTTSVRRSAWWTIEISFAIERLPGRCRGILPRHNEAPRACGQADSLRLASRGERAAASHSHGGNRARGPRWNQKRHAERSRAVPRLRPPTDRTGPAAPATAAPATRGPRYIDPGDARGYALRLSAGEGLV